MSWKAGLSRYLTCLRFFACPRSPSSRGVMRFFVDNYESIQLLNPGFATMMRTEENAMPAVTTELDWTVHDLLRFMIQTKRFRDANGTISEARIEAAQAYMKTDWTKFTIERFRSPGFDPERPGIDKLVPNWKENPQIQADLAVFMDMKKTMQEQMDTFRGGPNDEYTRAENALLMCQRVDLWCAGPQEVERAVHHLYQLGRGLNKLDVDFPTYIAEFYPSIDDMDDE